MQTSVILGGHLGRRFGRDWTFDLDTASPAEAVRALSTVCEGFKSWVLEHARPGYHVFVGRKSVTADELRDPTLCREIVIMPALAGAKSGWVSVILGGVLIAAGVVVTVLTMGQGATLGITLAKLGATMAIGTGISLATGGISRLLAQSPDAAKKEDKEPNYLFTGPVNTVGVGNVVPLCYGLLEVGSQVISAEITQQRPASGGVPKDDPLPGRRPGSWHDHFPKDGN